MRKKCHYSETGRGAGTVVCFMQASLVRPLRFQAQTCCTYASLSVTKGPLERMFSRAMLLPRGRGLARLSIRGLSTEVAASAPKPASGGSSFFQRLTSFLAGMGLASGVGFYFVLQDVQRSTDLVRSSLHDISKRIDRLEKK